MKKRLLYLFPALYVFTAQAQNDMCANATLLIPSTDCVPVEGSFAGATVTDIFSYDCWPNASQDVWFYFVATSNEMSLWLNNSPTNSMALYNESCDGTFFSCASVGGPPSGVGSGGTTFVEGQVYYVRVVNSSAELSSAVFTICVQGPAPLSSKDVNASKPILYPNPVTDDLTITGIAASGSFRLYNSLGQLVKKGNFSDGKIVMQELAAGVYYLELDAANGILHKQKIVKK